VNSSPTDERLHPALHLPRKFRRATLPQLLASFPLITSVTPNICR